MSPAGYEVGKYPYIIELRDDEEWSGWKKYCDTCEGVWRTYRYKGQEKEYCFECDDAVNMSDSRVIDV